MAHADDCHASNALSASLFLLFTLVCCYYCSPRTLAVTIAHLARLLLLLLTSHACCCYCSPRTLAVTIAHLARLLLRLLTSHSCCCCWFLAARDQGQAAGRSRWVWQEATASSVRDDAAGRNGGVPSASQLRQQWSVGHRASRCCDGHGAYTVKKQGKRARACVFALQHGANFVIVA
jgi:hypothetical protein